MGFREIEKAKQVKATIKLANEILSLERVPRDRALNNRRLCVYKQALERKEFRSCVWTKAYVKATKTWYRINGQHTSTLFVQHTSLFPPDYQVLLEVFECDTIDDLARLWSTYDSATQSRNAAEIYLTFSATVPELATMPGKFICKMVAGIGYYLWERSYFSMSPADRAEALFDYVGFCQWAWSISESVGADSENMALLLRMPVIAAMLKTWLKDKDDTDLFWKHVRDEDDDPDNATRKLMKWLCKARLISGGGAAKSKQIVSVDPREMHVRCIQAWNAWRDDEPTSLRYYPDKPVPDVA